MNSDSFFSIFFNAANRAAIQLLKVRNRYDAIDIDLFAQLGRRIYQAEGERLLAEWGNVVDAVVSDETLRQYVSVQALELGEKLADAYHDEMVWAS